MKKLIFAVLLVLVVGAAANADTKRAFTNQSASAVRTITWDDWRMASVSAQFPNRSTCALYIKASTNGGATYYVLTGYSTATAPWNYDIIRGVSIGVVDHLQFQYTNKSNKAVKSKGTIYYNVR